MYERLKSYGIPESRIKDAGNFYAVDGDMYFHKSDADLRFMDQYFGKPVQSDERVGGSGGNIAQAHTNFVVSSPNVEAVAIRVIRADNSPEGIDFAWYNAIHDAIRHWNAVSNTKISMVDYGMYKDGADANVRITFLNDLYDAVPPGNIAVAEFPNASGQPGFRIRLNSALNPNSFTHAAKVYIMVHEIGHCLGLRHANWQNESDEEGVGANHIPGTPWNDPNSVMQSVWNQHQWAGFSAGDIASVQYLYPWSNPMDKWITSPDSKYPDNMVHLVEDDQSLTVTWNSSLHATPTVTLRIYQHGVLLGTLGAGRPNTGSASFSRAEVMQAINYQGMRYTEGNLRIELISDSNPAVRDMTGYQVFRLNS